MSDEEDNEYTADMALADAQEEADKALKALARADFYIDANAPTELREALESVFEHLTVITWL